MDLKDQLQNLFPDHEPEPEKTPEKEEHGLWLQDDPLLCKFEKRRGKPITIVDGYTGAEEDFKKLGKLLKTKLGVGGSTKNDRILIQGDYRKEIMQILQDLGFNTKRVGG